MARAARKSSSSSTEDAVTLLKKDHATVKQLFKEFESVEDEDEKQAIAELICKLLTVHATIEEEIFYVEEEHREIYPQVKRAGLDVQTIQWLGVTP